jgi:hypothetical protein
MPAAFSALRWRLVAVACALGVGLGVGTSAGETYPVTPVSAPPIDTATRSCDELKSALRTAGALTLTSGPRGWGDTYYSGVPRCQFWQRPLFSFVTAKEGRCGVGYICTDKFSGG